MSEVAEVAGGVSRGGWLYRHFPDKNALLGAAIVRLNEAYWSDSHAMLERIEGLDQQIAAGIRHGRTAYADPGAILMKLRMEEPEEFAACAGAAFRVWCRIWGEFWSRYLVAAKERGEIHPDTDVAEASEWVARALLSLATVPGQRLDPHRPRRGAGPRPPLRHAGTASGSGTGLETRRAPDRGRGLSRTSRL